ncbi:hypothetical protein [Embleya sp. NPDC005575]|uniref:hypothetical protein n=1 Tax=Embleya sp. NPDC005575 TaxID=3156892 RepID=UPI0033AA639E
MPFDRNGRPVRVARSEADADSVPPAPDADVFAATGKPLPMTGEYQLWIKPPTDRTTPSTVSATVFAGS